MLLLYVAGLVVTFWIGFFMAAVVANEKRAEEVEALALKYEELKKRSGLYPEETGQKWLTWEDQDGTD